MSKVKVALVRRGSNAARVTGYSASKQNLNFHSSLIIKNVRSANSNIQPHVKTKSRFSILRSFKGCLLTRLPQS